MEVKIHDKNKILRRTAGTINKYKDHILESCHDDHSRIQVKITGTITIYLIYYLRQRTEVSHMLCTYLNLKLSQTK